MLKPRASGRALAIWMVILVGCSLGAARSNAGEISPPFVLPIPGGAAGIGFDDLGFSTALQRVIVPAGLTGNIVLIDPASRKMDELGGFSSQSSFGGGHGEGVTSADAGPHGIFATDRDEKALDLVDLKSKRIVAKAKLAGGPDYVRYVRSTNEVWVTEPHSAQIEIFSLPPHGLAEPKHASTIPVVGGPESLIIDDAHGLAYTNLWTDTTLAIDLRQRTVVARWRNGCRGSRGLALDSPRGFLFVGCQEGKLESLSLTNGHPLGEASAGDGVDIIGYAPQLHHAYLPGAKSATMAVIEIHADGKPVVLTTTTTAKHSHCVVADDLGNAYVCDPSKGQLLIFHDSLE
jgi:hypothetical protein